MRKSRERERERERAKKDEINVLCVFLLPLDSSLPVSNSSFPQVLVLRYVVIKASSMTVVSNMECLEGIINEFSHYHELIKISILIVFKFRI